MLSCSVVSDSLQPHGLQPATLLCLWDSSGKNTGVGCHFLLQGICPTQRLNPGLPHCTQTLPSELPGKPNKGKGSNQMEENTIEKKFKKLKTGSLKTLVKLLTKSKKKSMNECIRN